MRQPWLAHGGTSSHDPLTLNDLEPVSLALTTCRLLLWHMNPDPVTAED
jgi:hypothetical protein